MNKTEQSIKQGQYKWIDYKEWNFLKNWMKKPFNPYNVLTADSRKVPVFPKYQAGGSGPYFRVETYVRRKFFGKWYLIPVITQWESPKPLYTQEVVKEVIARNLDEGYRVFLYWKGIKEKDLHRMDTPDGKVKCQLLDENQEDEFHRLGIVR